MTDWNARVIEEFRANGGRVGGPFEGAPLLLLHSVGARTGAERVHPMMYLAVGESFAVFASKAGAETNPAWYHNLVAHPDARVEVGVEAGGETGIDTVDVLARVLDERERAVIWEEQKARYPGFADYESRTDRVIPVVLLERR